MDKEIQSIISRIYINHEENTAVDVESVQRIKVDLGGLLERFEHISFEVRHSHDTEYKKIEHGSCAVALDVIIDVDSSKHSMVIQISKLGNFAWLYWRKTWWIWGMSYKYKMPRGWSNNLVAQIRQAIEDYGIRFLEDTELDEEFVGIKTYFAAHDEDYARLKELLFCFDGAH